MDNMAENQKIERYLLRQMDEQEASEFEAFYLSNNECINQLEMAERLLEGLRFAKNTQEPLNPAKISTNSAANDNRWWQKGLPVWASAAMVVMTLLPSAFMYQELKQQSSPNAELSVVSLPLTETRSANQSDFSVPHTKQRMILSMFVDTELEQMIHSSYAFELIPIQESPNKSTTALLIDRLTLDSNDMLYVDLGKSVISPGRYRYSLKGLTEKNQPQEISSGVVTFEAQR